MIFVLDTAIGIGVWLPFTIGKSTALLSVRVTTIPSHTWLKLVLMCSLIHIVSFKSYTYQSV